MIVVRHTEECTSKPVAGRMTGKCNCKTAKLDRAAQKKLTSLLASMAKASLHANEQPEYFALRLDELAAQIEKDARGVRRSATRAKKATP